MTQLSEMGGTVNSQEVSSCFSKIAKVISP